MTPARAGPRLRLGLGGVPGLIVWAPLLLARGTAASSFGAWSAGLDSGDTAIAGIVLVAGLGLSVLSLALFLATILEYAGRLFLARCCSYPSAHAALAALWLPVVILSIYLAAGADHLPSLAFAVTGGVFSVIHCSTSTWGLCWCCCGGAPAAGVLTDHPKSALLTPQGDKGTRHRGGDDASSVSASISGGGGGSSAGGASSSAATVAPHGHGHGVVSTAEPGRNPFRTTYGLLPGSSSTYAYQIFLPGMDEEMGEANGPYVGLQGGPGGRRDKAAAAKKPSSQHASRGPSRTPSRGPSHTGHPTPLGHVPEHAQAQEHAPATVQLLQPVHELQGSSTGMEHPPVASRDKRP
ncbi:hypothetical protein HYH03_006272 [Edaphochlamys debaryana]|uniref:Uncharacterized protein n=1 Tax=Edaphochlamys debaryana TaxID=47281 RepID=A0A836C196_9CHLO|nr:hypothetical protein HYH03_006272 [Edaphochlamys debaryana]|eukprot:KAG2495672.1 hypothetical protein HYH03_006272 [Edaphochlamys debaryana]